MSACLTIIGSGLAAWNVARQWRLLDALTPLRILTADAGDFYSKPMLSTALAHNQSAERLRIKNREQMASELRADIIGDCRVSQIDREQRRLLTSAGDFDFERLVLAIGADPWLPPFEGQDLPDVLQVNDLQDYARLRERLQSAQRVVILGAGLIGCEFANDLAAAGLHTELVDTAAWPLNRLLPEVAGQYLQRCLQTLGVRCHWQTSIQSVTRDTDGLHIQLASGEILQADVLLTAVGLRPRIQLASQAQLKVNRGIVVDQMLRTSDADIYALGDCAEVRGLVLPYVQPIMLGARALASTLAGTPTPVQYPAMPVVVKTPCCPLVVAPAMHDDGEWLVENTAAGVRGLYYRGRDLAGFALLGDATAERQSLTSRLPAWLV